MRFTNRDLLWLTTVIGALLALVVSMRNSNRLQAKLSDLERNYQSYRIQRNARETMHIRELEKITGRKVRMFSMWLESDEPLDYGYEFKYEPEIQAADEVSN